MSSFKDQIKDSFSYCDQSNDGFFISIRVSIIAFCILILIVILYLLGKKNNFLNYFTYLSGIVCVLSFIISLICPITTIYGEMKKKQNNKIQPIS